MMNEQKQWVHGSLFSGIGGFDLAAQWMGWRNAFHCEMDPFCQKVLQHHWPDADLHPDVKKMNGKQYADRIDILTGGFPCQPYSAAGKREGKNDERHLWPEMLRIIREISPTWVVGENVHGLLNWSKGLVFTEIIADMEAAGYWIAPYLLPAAGVNAPHQRNRIFFICRKHTASYTHMPHAKHKVQTGGKLTAGPDESHSWFKAFPSFSPLCDGNDGISSWVDSPSAEKWRRNTLKAMGNAVVPPLIYQIFCAIEDMEQLMAEGITQISWDEFQQYQNTKDEAGKAK